MFCKLIVLMTTKERVDEYRFQPLEQTELRLFCLEPGRATQPLSGRLIRTTIAAAGALGGYEALSYVWGSSRELRSMSVDGFDISTTDSVETALLHLRSATKSRLLWCDQLCINQSDMLERGNQVQMMFKIFGSAKTVIAWLGSSTRLSGVGLAVLDDLSRRTQHTNKTPLWLSLPSHDVVAGLADIINRAWFTRLWIVQEAAVARRVLMVCGSHKFAWINDQETVRSFERSIKAAALQPQWQQQQGLEDINIDLFLQLLQMQLASGPGSDSYRDSRPLPDLLDMAYEMRHRASVDPRDRLYALLGMASKSHGVVMEVDYSKSVEEVYQDFEKLMLSKTRRRAKAPPEPERERSSGTFRLQSSKLPSEEESRDEAGNDFLNCSSTTEAEEDDELASVNGVAGGVEPTVCGASPHSRGSEVDECQSPRPGEAGVCPEDQQRHIIANHIELTMERTSQLAKIGSLGRAAALVAQLAQDIRQCADTMEQGKS
ncbi:hypothetical protein LTR85_003103 [Meristemomyces frigidus]|nr:hypothetical protein LTR85_003103 [Meristemomyces frigidus]